MSIIITGAIIISIITNYIESRLPLIIRNGIGGANTQSGIEFEKATDLSLFFQKHHYRLMKFPSLNYSTAQMKNTYLVYDQDELIGYLTRKSQYHKLIHDQFGVTKDDYVYKQWQPDEAFYNLKDNTIYIVEKKYQNTPGSVDEKPYSFPGKLEMYRAMFDKVDSDKRPRVEFIAVFNAEWFLDESRYAHNYEGMFLFLKNHGIKCLFDGYELSDFGI